MAIARDGVDPIAPGGQHVIADVTISLSQQAATTIREKPVLCLDSGWPLWFVSHVFGSVLAVTRGLRSVADLAQIERSAVHVDADPHFFWSSSERKTLYSCSCFNDLGLNRSGLGVLFPAEEKHALAAGCSCVLGFEAN